VAGTLTILPHSSFHVALIGPRSVTGTSAKTLSILEVSLALRVKQQAIKVLPCIRSGLFFKFTKILKHNSQ